jgi:hypothetical protein
MDNLVSVFSFGATRLFAGPVCTRTPLKEFAVGAALLRPQGFPHRLW